MTLPGLDGSELNRLRRDEERRPGERHDWKVARIAADLRQWPAGRPLSLRKKAVSHQVPKGGDAKYRDAQIDISDLNEILEIDPTTRICVAEPGVTLQGLKAGTDGNMTGSPDAGKLFVTRPSKGSSPGPI